PVAEAVVRGRVVRWPPPHVQPSFRGKRFRATTVGCAAGSARSEPRVGSQTPQGLMPPGPPAPSVGVPHGPMPVPTKTVLVWLEPQRWLADAPRRAQPHGDHNRHEPWLQWQTDRPPWPD